MKNNDINGFIILTRCYNIDMLKRQYKNDIFCFSLEQFQTTEDYNTATVTSKNLFW